MISVLICLLVFFAGCIVCGLLRPGQERQPLPQTPTDAAGLDDPLEMAYEEWALNPAYWCNRPGCARCYGWWGLS